MPNATAPTPGVLHCDDRGLKTLKFEIETRGIDDDRLLWEDAMARAVIVFVRLNLPA